MLSKKLPIIVAVTGASGAVYGLALLEFLLANDFYVDLVYSTNALEVAYHELAIDLRKLDEKSFRGTILAYLQSLQRPASHLRLLEQQLSNNLKLWQPSNIAASISSGSYRTQGMIVAPASMGTIANIALGTSNNLISRAADVVLKERRRLLLLARETPLSTIHLRNMLSLSEMGAVILPAAPAFYQNPKSIEDQVYFVLGKTLDAFGIEHSLFERWTYLSQLGERV